MNICDAIARHAEQQPQAPALIEAARSIDYGALDTLIRRTAAHLQNLGVRPSDRVGLCLKDNADYIVALLAVARMGGVALPLDWRARGEELQRLERAFAPHLILVEAGAAPPLRSALAALDDSWRAAVAVPPPETKFAGDGGTDWLLALSSGTTGAPRGAFVTHADYLARTARLARNYGESKDFRYVSVTPFVFSAGRNQVLYILLGGGTVILYPTLFSPEEYVEQVAKHQASYAFVVPTVLRWLLKLPDTGRLLLPSVQKLVTGGTFVSADEKREIVRRISPHLYVSYASSATGQIALWRPQDVTERADSAGQVNPLLTVEIVDEAEQPVPVGTIGRLRCRGTGIGARFYGEADLPEADAPGSWVYTGELATLDDDGYIFLKGRTSEIIIRDGINIYPEEIEQLLRTQPGVAEAALVGAPSEQHGEEAVAFVVADGPFDPRALLAACRKHLMAYKVPSEIVVIDKLPKTAGGKIKKNELAARL